MLNAACAVLAALSLSGCLASDPAQTRVATFEANGVSIRYAEAGEGEPIVLLHGWMGDASSWGKGTPDNPQLKAPAGYRLIAPDLRGHGRSSKPHGVEAYGEEMAMDVVRLMDHLGIKRAHLVGYSMGSYVAGKVAELAPDRVASVVYGGSAPVLNTRREKRFGAADAFAKAAEAGGGMGGYIVDTTPAGQPKPSMDDANRYAEAAFANQDVKALAAAGKAFGRLEVDAARLAARRTPAIFIYGEGESAFVLERIAEAQAALPHAQYKVVPKANHITALVAPQFGTWVMEFIKAHPIR